MGPAYLCDHRKGNWRYNRVVHLGNEGRELCSPGTKLEAVAMLAPCWSQWQKQSAMLAGPATGRLPEAKTLRLELQGCPGTLFGEMGISNREEGSAQALRCDGQ